MCQVCESQVSDPVTKAACELLESAPGGSPMTLIDSVTVCPGCEAWIAEHHVISHATKCAKLRALATAGAGR